MNNILCLTNKSASHKKGIALVKALSNRVIDDETAGQIFWNSHTTLGFAGNGPVWKAIDAIVILRCFSTFSVKF